MQQVAARNDPAPSRWAYRYQRLMLTPLFRKMLRVGVPFCLTFSVATFYLSDPKVQQSLVGTYTDLREQIENRPEFMVNLLAVEGASEGVAAVIREEFTQKLPVSSFDIDLDALRQRFEEMPAVASAAVRLRQGGVLEVAVTERVPAALILTREGFQVVDLEGVVIALAPGPEARPDLPVLTGEGAAGQVAEAMAIRAAAAPLRHRVKGLVRMGQRRWDVVLDRDQRILLPEENPVRALERVIVLNESQDMLERDIAVVDMRLADRPTLRMRENAVEAWWQVQKIGFGIDVGTDEE
jgi:cell division protein FtsQ